MPTTLATLIASLVRVPLPMVPAELTDYDALKTILSEIETQLATLSVPEPPGAGVTGGVGLDVTLAPYSMDKTGAADCSTAMANAITAGFRTFYFPAGRYRFDTKVVCPANTTIIGEGPHVTEIDCRDDYWVELLRNTNTAYTLDWCRGQITGLSLDMDKGGILGHGHEIRIWNMRFRQGLAGRWCIELHAANECAVWNISGGYGGGSTGYDLKANGLRWYATDDASERGVNYGDGLIYEVSFKGSVANWKGIALEHLSTLSTNGAINNLVVARVQCQAPAPSGASDPDGVLTNLADPTSIYVKNGGIGLELNAVQRSTFIAVDLEGCFTGLNAIGRNIAMQGGTTRRNVFIGCQAFNCRNEWLDTNGSLDGSVGQNTFLGGQEFGPLGPVGLANSDPSELYTGRRSTYDAILPGGLWFSRPGNSQPQVVVRMDDNHAILIAENFQENPGTSPDATNTPAKMVVSALLAGNPASWVTAGGMPKGLTPRKALRIDVASSNNAAKINRARGYTTKGWDQTTQTWTQTEEARIEIGNGPGFTIPDGGSTIAVGPLHRVQIQDPLYLREVATAKALVVQNFTSQPATIVNVQARTHLSTNGPNWWIGPCLYAQVRDDASSGRRWIPIMNKLGMRPCSPSRGSATYTIGRDDLGTIKGYSGGSGVGCTLTIPNNLLNADEVHATGTTGYAPSTSFDIVRLDSDPLTLDCSATGLTVYVDGLITDTATIDIPSINVPVRVHYVQTGATTATVWFDNLRAGYVGQLATNSASTDQTVSRDMLAKGFLELNPGANINLSFSSTLLPAGFGTASLVVVNKHATNTVTITAGGGMTLNLRGALTGTLRQNTPVTVHIVGTNIYIQGEIT